MAVSDSFTPYRVLEVEINQPLPDIPPESGGLFANEGRALVLVRMHTIPLGIVEIEMEQGKLTRTRMAEAIWGELHERINEHLVQDGLPTANPLSMEGLSTDGMEHAACLAERRRVLTNPPSVSVLVATRDRPNVLATCLDSLLDMEYPNFEIIVIDNAPSNEDTAEMIHRQYAGTRCVRYVREARPGLAVAHNCGLRETHAPFVAITDDDVTVDRYWLVEIMQGFYAAERVGCVTGMIFPSEIKTQAQYWIERSAGYAKGFKRRAFNLTDRRPADTLFPYAAGTFGSGANMAFRTAALHKLGGFDRALGVGSIARGGDDLASFFEVIVDGWTLVYNPAAIVHHRHYREYERLRRTAFGYGAGLTAYLTKVMIDHPGRILDMTRRIPAGLQHALSSGSAKNARKAIDYPSELTWIERKGMLSGPFLYLRSRWKR